MNGSSWGGGGGELGQFCALSRKMQSKDWDKIEGIWPGREDTPNPINLCPLKAKEIGFEGRQKGTKAKKQSNSVDWQSPGRHFKERQREHSEKIEFPLAGEERGERGGRDMAITICILTRIFPDLHRLNEGEGEGNGRIGEGI